MAHRQHGIEPATDTEPSNQGGQAADAVDKLGEALQLLARGRGSDFCILAAGEESPAPMQPERQSEQDKHTQGTGQDEAEERLDPGRIAHLRAGGLR